MPAWFSQGFNLGQLRTTWMQESKLTPVFKGEEKQGLDIINFNQSQLHLPGRLCRTGIILLTVLPRQVTDGVFKAPGRGTARLSSCFPLSGESCLRPKCHTYILVLFYLQHRGCTLIFGYLSQNSSSQSPARFSSSSLTSQATSWQEFCSNGHQLCSCC